MHRTFPNVLVTPHQGFYTREALLAIASSTITSISEFSRYVNRIFDRRWQVQVINMMSFLQRFLCRETQPASSIIYRGAVIKEMKWSGQNPSKKASNTSEDENGKGCGHCESWIEGFQKPEIKATEDLSKETVMQNRKGYGPSSVFDTPLYICEDLVILYHS